MLDNGPRAGIGGVRHAGREQHVLGQQLCVRLPTGQLEHTGEYRETRGAVDAVRSGLEGQRLPHGQRGHAGRRLRSHLVDRLGNAMRDSGAVVEQIVDGDLVGSREIGQKLPKLVGEREPFRLEQTGQDHDGHRLVDRADAELRLRRDRQSMLVIGRPERLLV